MCFAVLFSFTAAMGLCVNPSSGAERGELMQSVSAGARRHPAMPACWNHCAYGDRRQHQHGTSHRYQMWHHPPRRRLSVHRREGVQQEDQEREGRGTVVHTEYRTLSIQRL